MVSNFQYTFSNAVFSWDKECVQCITVASKVHKYLFGTHFCVALRALLLVNKDQTLALLRADPPHKGVQLQVRTDVVLFHLLQSYEYSCEKLIGGV